MRERDRETRQVAVIGLGRFGLALATTLVEYGYEVLGIDPDETMIQHAKDLVTHAVQAELSDAEIVRELGLNEVDIAVVAIGRDIEGNVFTTALLLEAGVPYVVARANSLLHRVILERIGAHQVVMPESDSGKAVAHSLRAPGISGYIDLTRDIGIGKLPAPPDWVGLALADLHLPGHGPFVTLAIQRGDETLAMPDPTVRIAAGDILALLIEQAKLDELPHAWLGRR